MRVILGAAALAVLAACSPGAKSPTPAEIAGESRRLTAYLDAEFEEEMAFSPEQMTGIGRKDKYDQLDDRTEGMSDTILAWRRQSVADMKAGFDTAKLDDAAKTSFEIWALELERAESAEKWRRHRYQFARGGPHTDLPNFLINLHRVDEPSDLDAYLGRLSLIDKAVDQTIELARLAAAGGVRPPAFAYTEAIGEAKRVVTGAPFGGKGDSALFADVKTKMRALQDAGKINAAEASAYRERAASTMLAQMAPAYDRLVAYLEAERSTASKESRGALALPDGAAYYAAALKLMTTTDMTAEEIHELGLAEVARLRGEMQKVKSEVGFDGTLDEFFVFMRTDKRFFLPNTDAGRAEYLERAEAHLSAMTAKLPEYFGLLPKGKLVVRRVEAFREQPGAAQHYNRGSVDGTRPAIFYAHLSDMNAMPVFQLEPVAYHEGVPGHHLQIAIAQELTGLPVFRTQYGYTAFSEGWGLYAEALAKEMGGYADPHAEFGRLSTEIWRAVRLVVDTGIHAKGWSEEQAVQYFLANSASAEGAVRSEIQRYILNPGQATAYKIGMLKIQELRRDAEAALGRRFDIRGFHDVVLGGGGVPLPVLEARVKRWIAAQQ